MNNQFDLIIEVPEILPEPGTYWFSLYATEINDEEESGIGSLLSVNLRFLIEVPPHGKAISVSLEIPDVNEHQQIPIAVNIVSKGLENINLLTGKVTIYDQKNLSVASLNLKGKPLPALASTTLSANLPADKLSPAKYWAKAVVNYDGEEKIAQDAFKIGNLDLILVNYTSQLEPEFSEFNALVENNWGNPIQIAYAIVSINETELLTTPTISLGPWQKGELKGILRTDFVPGNYSGSIKLFYDDLSKTEGVLFTIIQPPSEVQKTSVNLFIVMGVILLLIISFSALLYLIKHNKDKK